MEEKLLVECNVSKYIDEREEIFRHCVITTDTSIYYDRLINCTMCTMYIANRYLNSYRRFIIVGLSDPKVSIVRYADS